MGSTQRFSGKVAVVTGAGNGIGLAIAKAFALEGASVVIADINRDAGEAAAAAIGSPACAIALDVADEVAVEALVEASVARFGRIDILVNNAGLVLHRSIVDMPRSDWDRQLAVQVTGPFLLSKHVARHMIARGGGGKIVNITSLAGMVGREQAVAHCVSKGGLAMLTKVAAMEWAQYGINVNAVAPGLIDVPNQRNEQTLSKAYRDSYVRMIPFGRMGETDEVANMVLFLTSEDAAWITGQEFIVDGGTMAGHFALAKKHEHAELFGERGS